jgi:hypothetical protein
VFDTTNGKIVGTPTGLDGLFYRVANPGLLSFRFEPVDGGKSFKVIAQIQGWVPYSQDYVLSLTGIRGLSVIDEPWLEKLYLEHAARAVSGAFKFNPRDEGVSVELTGKPEADDPVTAVAGILHSEPESSGTTPAENAEMPPEAKAEGNA